MTNFVFDTWKTNAPSENQRASIFTFFSNMADIVGIWLAKIRWPNVG